MDRMRASGACDVGSTPTGGTNYIFYPLPDSAAVQ